MGQNQALLVLCCLIVSLSFALGAHARSTTGSGPASYGYNGPKPNLGGKPKPDEQEDLSTTPIGVQGLVSCRSYTSKLSPLQGAVVRLTCLATDEDGYELPPFSILSPPTDENGYFLATLALLEMDGFGKISECKAFLNSSPSDTCNIPTDVNDGISGASLHSHHLLNDKKTKLYSVGPFIYTSSDHPSINNGY